jgi:tetratricopeptide (TPR) repeat protein
MPNLPALEARVLPDSPPSRGASWWNWLLAGGAFMVFVAGFAAALWGLGQWLQRNGGLAARRPSSLVQIWEPPAERLVAIRSAMDADDVGATPAELRELNRLFARVTTGGSTGAASTANLVDYDAMADRILRHPLLASEQKAERARLRRQLEYDIKAVPRWSDLRVVHVVKSPAANEAVVYTLATNPGREATVVRWWLTRRGRSWQLCDWEQIDIGFSEAARRAVDRAVGVGAGGSAYRQAMSLINGVKTAPAAQTAPLMVQQLLKAQAIEVPEAAHDLVQLEMASAWLRGGRRDKTLAVCDDLRDKEAHAGVHYLRAVAYWQREEYAEAAAAAAEYRRRAGRHPHLLEIEAEALEALGRSSEAAGLLSELLGLYPDDTAALGEYCRVAGEGSYVRVAQVIDRAARPLDFAVDVASEAIEKEQEALLAAAEWYVRDKAPESALVELIAGMKLRQREKYEEAAEHFYAAAKRAADDHERREHFYRYWNAMVQAGRAVEAYQKSEDAVECFAHLTRNIETANSALRSEELPGLIAEHRKRAASDPALKYCEGVLAEQKRDYATAEKWLDEAESAAGDGDLRQRIGRKKLEVLYRQGRLRDAYQGATNKRSALFELGWLCQRERDWRALGDLIDLRRAEQADDPWIDYFTAIREDGQGDFAAAWDAIKRAEVAMGGDESLRMKLDVLKRSVHVPSEKIIEAYRSAGDQRETFRRLVTDLANQEDWEHILELTAEAPRRSTTLYWATKAHFGMGEFQQVVDSLTPWPYDRLGRVDGAQLAELCDMAVRSELRLGRLDAAQAAADRARDEYGLETPELAVMLAKGDQQGLRALVNQPRIGQSLFGRQLYQDRDLAPLLVDAELGDVRRRYAIEWPAEEGAGNLSVVFMWQEPLAPARLDSILGAVLPPADAEVVGDGRRTQMWTLTDAVLLVTAAEGRYVAKSEIPDFLAAKDRARSALEEHRAWIAIDVSASDRTDRQRVLPLVQRLAGKLAATGATAVYVSGAGGQRGRLTAIDSASMKKLSTDEFYGLQTSGSSVSEVHLFPGEATDQEGSHFSDRVRELRRLADRARVLNADGHALVRARLKRGHSTEDVWLKVIRFQRLDEEEGQFIAEMTTASRLWPFLHAGERVRLDFYEPLEVREVGSPSVAGR